MPSKLRKALGAVKDQTSISLAKVTNAANLEVIILKATTHDEIPMEERYINEIVHLVSSSKVYAAACAQYIGKRIGKTKSWVVVLKSLMIILRIFQDGDPYFPREVFHAMKRGAKILNLSGFRDDSSSSPWDYTAFVRTIALYLDERLDCFLTGKLQRRVTLKNQSPFKNQKHKKLFNETGIKDMKPAMLLDRISYWQRLLDRAMGTKPTGSARTNRLVQISLYAIVQETFDLYKDVSDGLAVILDSFFKLPCKACIAAFQACVKSYKQFDELSSFYSFCVNIGVGRTSEYPAVQKVSEELMEALQEFLREQATNIDSDNAQSSSHSPLSKHLLVSALRETVGSSNYNSGQDEGYGRYGTPERHYETASEYGSSQCTSLEDLMSATDAGILTPRRSPEMDYEQDEKQSQNNDDISSAYESCSNHSYPIDQTARSSLDLVSLDDVQQEGEKQRNNAELGSNNNTNVASNDCWELVLVETATTSPEKTSNNNLPNGFDSSLINTLFDQPSMPQNQYNPFLEVEDIAMVSSPTATKPTLTTIDENLANFIDLFIEAPTVAAPTFRAHQESSEATLMAPTFTAQSSSSETDLALIFGDLNSNNRRAMPPTFHSEDSADNNMALVPAFQAKNIDEMPTTATFYSQDSFKITSTPTFNSQGSFKTSPPSTYQGHNSHHMSSTPTLNSQDCFKINSASTLQDHNSYRTSSAPTFNSQGSFKSNTASAFSGHNSYPTNTTRTFSSQGSFKVSSTSASEDHNQMSIAPTFCGHNAYQTSTASTSQGHNSYLTNIAPVSHNSYQTSTHSSFQYNNSYQMSTEQTFQCHNSYETSIERTFCSHNSYQTSTKPTFQCHDSSQSSTTPTVHCHNTYQMSTEPSFHTHNSHQTSTTPTFQAYNAYQMSRAPTFGLQNLNLSMAEATPSLAKKNPNESMAPLSFWRQNFHDTMVVPTFCAKVSNETMVGSPKEDDLFGPWPSVLTSNEHALNKSTQEQSLVQQQQVWLEQQNKIIAKHMT